MTDFVVDASIAVKWFKTEDEGEVDAALRLLERHDRGDIRLLAPALLAVEVANALHSSAVPDETVASALADLFGFGVWLRTADQELLVRAVSLARGTGASIYDSLYLALAIERDCPYVTADRRAHAKMRHAGDVRLLGEA